MSFRLWVMAQQQPPTTHGVAISANNMAEMTALFEENQNNPAWAEFLRSVKDIRTVEDDSFVIQLKSWGS